MYQVTALALAIPPRVSALFMTFAYGWAFARPVRKVFTPVGITFKGNGFYKTDNRGKSSSTASSSSSSSSDSSTPTMQATFERSRRSGMVLTVPPA